jgi:predicted ATPase
MNIRELSIEGFRSLKQVTWRPGGLNVVIGPNGTGKSNLLRMLELISIAAQGRLGRYVQASGGMDALVWDGRASRIAFRVRIAPLAGLAPERELTYSLQLAQLGAGSAYRIEHELLGDYRLVESGEQHQPFKYLERRNLDARVFDEQERSLVAPPESVPEEETLLSLAAGPFTANPWILPFQQQLASWSVYHDLHVNSGAPIRQPAVTRSERRVEPDGQNLISVLHTLYTGDRYFKQSINAAMRAAFGDDFDELIFPPASDQRIQLRIRWKTLEREQSAADLSDGTLRFLFLMTVLASPSPPPLIAIDEPETGLHPSMFPIVAEYAVDAAERAQVILTTHSDQFLDAFGDNPPTTTVAKWNDGVTTLHTLDREALKYWLSDYSLGKLFRSGELEQMA